VWQRVRFASLEHEMQEADGQGTVPAPSPVFPWRHAFLLVGASLLIAVPSFLMAGQVAAIASVAGFMTGGFAASSAGLRGTLAGGAGLLAALALLLISQSLPIFAAVCALLCLAAGVEASRQGTRISVMVLLGVTVMAVALARGPDPLILPLAVLGLATGHFVIGHLGLTGMLCGRPAAARHAARLGLFLAFGMALSVVFVALMDGQRSYWIALLFVSRALVPFPDRKEPLLRYGTGAAAGVLAAVLIEAMGLPDVLRLLLALGALVLGIRFLIHPMPIAPAMMTMAVLLGTAPTAAEALFRAEAIALVFAIILMVGLVVDQLWAAVPGPEDDGSGQGAPRRE
jgi:hypothetical protein